MNGRDHGVGPHLFDVSFAKFIRMRGRELEPSRERVAADHGRSQRPAFSCFTHALTVQPPSTVMTWPVIGLDSFRKRKHAVFAMSSGAIRPFVKGCLWATYSMMPASPCARALIGVLTNPAARTLIRIPAGA